MSMPICTLCDKNDAEFQHLQSGLGSVYICEACVDLFKHALYEVATMEHVPASELAKSTNHLANLLEIYSANSRCPYVKTYMNLLHNARVRLQNEIDSDWNPARPQTYRPQTYQKDSSYVTRSSLLSQEETDRILFEDIRIHES